MSLLRESSAHASFIGSNGPLVLAPDYQSPQRDGIEWYDRPFWVSNDPYFRPDRLIPQVRRVPVFNEPNVPSVLRLQEVLDGKREYTEDEVLPGHRSASGPPKQLDPTKFLLIYDQEKAGSIARRLINLTPPLGIHADTCIMTVPSLHTGGNVPTELSHMSQSTREDLFQSVGQGIERYEDAHEEVVHTSYGVTYGHWKSIGEKGPVHGFLSFRTEEELARARVLPLRDLDSDLPGLYGNNTAGIQTACDMADRNILETQYGLPIVSTNVTSSGTVTFEIAQPLPDLLREQGATLFPYLEGMMENAWVNTAESNSTLRDTYSYDYFLRCMCGAIVFTKGNDSPNTFLHITTGLNMNEHNPARGGIFTAQGIWVERSGLAPISEALAYHQRVQELVSYML